jgi:hypothetical protein
MWMAYKQRHPDTVPVLNALIAAHRPLPFEREAFRIDRQQTLTFEPSRAVRFIQPAVTALGWLTALLAIGGVAAALAGRPLPPALSVACVASLTAHSGLLLSAAFAAAIGRFIVSLWPAITTAALLAAWSLAAGRPRAAQAPQSPAAG